MKKFSRLLFVLLLASCLLTPSSLLAKVMSDNNEKIETLQKLESLLVILMAVLG